mmetsp:Transcript_1252/g.2922  ORF Transcript_1252/g.2922 Transcript_1252/m.2922 type:complete len:236 (-) Transcript_1252:133-840(-)|eukprot:CAMPEP_0114494124 /NCGR_PEP_ID=MMETSP0109-20121206/4481_1 /TAXON_ID=29199 /ORGANISM="Chlorarachnion reptans, Strain CCCM449" /LENGTH=235 /DNA_ID=CAMNT_0001671133 /DNA_START=22 /DNA_END=729 /DNA_ORIENTATION=-
MTEETPQGSGVDTECPETPEKGVNPENEAKPAGEAAEGQHSENREDDATEGKESVPATKKDKEAALEAKARGNQFFREGAYEKALEEYTKAIELCPESDKENLAAFYCNSAAVHGKLEDWDSVIKNCTEAINIDSKYVKAYLRRSIAYEKEDKIIEAYEDAKKGAELAPNTTRLVSRAAKLAPVAQERQEKMKNEMLGKLKDLGNMFLGNFGMSMNNFKAQKDPNTGSYNISYQP